MSDPVLQFYFDQFENKLINSNTGSTTVNVTIPQFFRKNHYTVEVYLYYDYPTTSDVSGQTDWHLGIGNLGSTGPLIETTDCDDSNAATGVLVFSNCNSHSAAFLADLSTTATKQYYVEVTANDGTNDNSLMIAPSYAKNSVY